MRLLAEIVFPTDVERFAALSLGTVTLVLTVMIHGAGLRRIMLRHERALAGLPAEGAAALRASLLFGWSIYLLLLLHAFEIFVWTMLVYLPGLVSDFHDAVYYVTNAYTTLGFGETLIRQQWRAMAPFISIGGLFTFAWTGSTLVALGSAGRSQARNSSQPAQSSQ